MPGGSPPTPTVPQEIAHFKPDGACRVSSVDFFSIGVIETRRAIAICETCNVKAECLAWAVALPERFGVWGGQTATARRRHTEGKPWPKPFAKKVTIS